MIGQIKKSEGKNNNTEINKYRLTFSSLGASLKLFGHQVRLFGDCLVPFNAYFNLNWDSSQLNN